MFNTMNKNTTNMNINSIQQEIDKLNAYELLTKISSSKITNFESIRRLRMQLQQNDEELRGSEYKNRKKRIDPTFRVFLRD